MAHLDDSLSYHDGRIAVRGKWLSGLLIRLIEGRPEVDHMHAIDRRHVCDERRVRPGEGVEAEARTDRVDVGPKLGDLDDLDRRDPRDEGVVGKREAEGERRPRGPDEEADCPRESSEDPMEEHRRLLEGDKSAAGDSRPAFRPLSMTLKKEFPVIAERTRGLSRPEHSASR